MDNELITVTSPLLPNLDDFNEMLKQIWASKWITNNGSFHKQLEKELAVYLKVPYIRSEERFSRNAETDLDQRSRMPSSA